MSTSTLEELRTQKRDAIMALAEKHGITDVRVFGSVAREEDEPDSDIDFVITLENGRDIHDWLAFQHGLEDLLEREIDVFPEKNIRRFIKPTILKEAKTL